MNAKGIVQTMLLAVKHFRPDPSLGKVTGKVVMLWVRQVLAQNGVDEKDVVGAVTDAGGDVRTGVGEAFDREWCIPHMSNRATIDGTGMSQSRDASKNLICRDLLDLCKKVVEMANRSASFKVYLERVRRMWYIDLFCGGYWTVWILVEQQHSECPTPKAHPRGKTHVGFLPRRHIFAHYAILHPPSM